MKSIKTKFSKKYFLLVAAFFLMFCILLGCGNNKNKTTVSVAGIGSVTAEPDMANIIVSLTHVAPTTRQAQEEVNRMTARLLEIFKRAGIEDRNIRTLSLSFRPEYDFSNNRQTIRGQRAEQTMIVSIEGIDTSPEKLPNILDEITSVDRVILQQVVFSIKDRSGLFSESRELAYQRALEKATQYASLAGLRVVKPLSISEFDANNFNPITQNRMVALADMGGMGRTATSLPTGELEVTSQIFVVFLLE